MVCFRYYFLIDCLISSNLNFFWFLDSMIDFLPQAKSSSASRLESKVFCVAIDCLLFFYSFKYMYYVCLIVLE